MKKLIASLAVLFNSISFADGIPSSGDYVFSCIKDDQTEMRVDVFENEGWGYTLIVDGYSVNSNTIRGIVRDPAQFMKILSGEDQYGYVEMGSFTEEESPVKGLFLKGAARQEANTLILHDGTSFQFGQCEELG